MVVVADMSNKMTQIAQDLRADHSLEPKGVRLRSTEHRRRWAREAIRSC